MPVPDPVTGHVPARAVPGAARENGPDAADHGHAVPGRPRGHASSSVHGHAAGHTAGHPDRPESARERVNRRWNEVLQETRVTQTGVQILFGFLLSVAFTEGFEEMSSFDRTVYVVTVLLGSAATGALIAPVSIHRFLTGQRMKEDVVDTAGRLMVCGMVLLALTIGSTLLLILHVVLDDLLAEILVGIVMVWFVACWYLLPAWLRRRSARGRR